MTWTNLTACLRLIVANRHWRRSVGVSHVSSVLQQQLKEAKFDGPMARVSEVNIHVVFRENTTYFAFLVQLKEE